MRLGSYRIRRSIAVSGIGKAAKFCQRKGNTFAIEEGTPR
jgi:hypothetical protein